MGRGDGTGGGFVEGGGEQDAQGDGCFEVTLSREDKRKDQQEHDQVVDRIGESGVLGHSHGASVDQAIEGQEAGEFSVGHIRREFTALPQFDIGGAQVGCMEEEPTFQFPMGFVPGDPNRLLGDEGRHDAGVVSIVGIEEVELDAKQLA